MGNTQLLSSCKRPEVASDTEVQGGQKKTQGLIKNNFCSKELAEMGLNEKEQGKNKQLPSQKGSLEEFLSRR